jgi:capsular polysaccharide biosynthesis protein
MRETARLCAPSLAHVDARDQVAWESVFGPQGRVDPVWERSTPTSLARMEGNLTSIVSRWNDGTNFYHHFMDGLTRLAHLRSFPDDCRILVPKISTAFAARSYEILGLVDRLAEAPGGDLLVGRYWFAGPTALSGCPNPAGVAWLKDRFLSGPDPKPDLHLYVMREASTRTVENHGELRRFLEQRGWTAVNPAGYSLDDQITLFRRAKSVIGVHGAALTNLLWSQAGCKVLELMPAGRRNGCYAGICHSAGLIHQTLLCPSDRHGSMSVPIGRLEIRLDLLPEEIVERAATGGAATGGAETEA